MEEGAGFVERIGLYFLSVEATLCVVAASENGDISRAMNGKSNVLNEQPVQE